MLCWLLLFVVVCLVDVFGLSVADAVVCCVVFVYVACSRCLC